MTLLSGRHTGLEHHVAQGGLHHFPLQLVGVRVMVFITTAGFPNLFALVILGSTVMCSNLWAGYSGSSHLEASDHHLRTLYLNYFRDALSWDSPFLKPVSADLSEQSSAFIHLSYAFLVDPPSWNTSLPLSYKVCAHFFKITVLSIYPNG